MAELLSSASSDLQDDEEGNDDDADADDDITVKGQALEADL